MSAASRSVDWQPLREAFVQRSPRPTHAELSAEFHVPLGTIGVCASEEGWTDLRAQFLETRLKQADAGSVLLEAIKIDRTLIRAISDFALTLLLALARTVERVTDDKAPSTNLECLNTASFALLNCTRALREAGVIGLPKGMGDAGKEDNGRWNPEMLQQINVTVQNLTAQAAQADKVVAAATKAAPEVDLG